MDDRLAELLRPSSSPELLPPPAPHTERGLEQILAGFFMNVRSPLTAREYRLAAKEFFSCVAHEVRVPSDLERHHIIYYRQYLEARGLANKTIQKKLAAVSSLCRHLAEEGLIDRNITYGVTRPLTENKTETADLSDDEVRRVFISLKGAKKEKMWTAILAFGFFTGLRSKEIRSLKWRDIGDLKGITILRVKTKGGKMHELPLHPFLCRALDDYEAETRAMAETIAGDALVFPGRGEGSGKILSADALAYILNESLERAGIEKSRFRRYSPHTMRATFAGHLLNKAEASLEDVQAALGHANPSTTQKYNKRSKGHEKSAVWKIDY